MKKLYIILSVITLGVVSLFAPIKVAPATDVTNPLYEELLVRGISLVRDDTEGVQVPIPMKDRVYNKTGIQCCWSSAETLARYAEIKILYDLTERPEYRSYANPDPVKRMFNRFNVKYKMQYAGNKDTKILIQTCKIERRGIAFAISGHVMVLVHFDPKADVVKYINNSDRTLAIRTWSMEKFMRVWTGWCYVPYGEPDLIPRKYNPWRRIPIINKMHDRAEFKEDYLAVP